MNPQGHSQRPAQRVPSTPGSKRRCGLDGSRTRLIFFVFIAVGTPSLAQVHRNASTVQTQGSIQGVVSVEGPGGETTVLVGATLELTDSPHTNVGHSGFSDSSGHYQFDGLPAGTYQLQAQAEGMEPVAKTIPLGVNELHVENVVLQIRPIVQKVEVSEHTEAVSTEAASPTASFKSEQFNTLPTG